MRNDIIVFEDDEIDEICEYINDSQILFHPKFSSEGKISIENLLDLQRKNVKIILDNNIVSSLYNIAKDGFLRIKMSKKILQYLWCIVIY